MSQMRTIVQHTPEFSGMALGGIGTGTVEIFPNGRLENWSIFNRGKWASRSPKQDNLQDDPALAEEQLCFYLRTAVEGEESIVRKLSYDSPVRKGCFRSAMYSWMKCIPEIAWTPNFPISLLEYHDQDLPVEISAEYSSPFLPHNSRVSGTPGFSINYTIKNCVQKPVTVSLSGLLQNPVCRGTAQRKLCNKIYKSDGTTMLTMSCKSDEKLPQNGSISLMAIGGEHSYLCGEFEAYLKAYVLGYEFGATEESCLFDFRKTGRLPNLGWESLPDLSDFTPDNIAKMGSEQIEQLLSLILQTAWGLNPWKRLCELVPSPVNDIQGKRNFLTMLANRYQQFTSPDNEEHSEWGGGALCSMVTVGPSETVELSFLFGWHFPFHSSPTGEFIGHQYDNWFTSSAEVCCFLAQNRQDIFPKVKEFSRLLGETDAPDAFPRGWTAHLNTMIKCSWWTKNGDFGIWEGFGSCGFHTTDITYHGSWGLVSLFPELQCRQMRMGAQFQREDGRVHHFFTPDFSSVDNGFDRVDMNPQFVLMVCRDYLWTGDRQYLDDLWPNVVRAMESTTMLDSDGDGLPDTDTGTNTYDAWKFQGVPTYIAALWLGALTAGIRLAVEMDNKSLIQKWGVLLKTGKKSFAKLWNGSYYNLWVDGELRDECCMSDQLDGLWYSKIMGLSPFLDEKSVSETLDSILKWNFSSEGGLINASYPPDTIPTLFTHQNVQALANWTGIEYAFVSLLLEYNRFQSATLLADVIEKRYWYAGRTFDHEECGDFYYRPLSSWTMLLSLSQFRLDCSKKQLHFALVPEIHYIPWFSPAGYGQIKTEKDRIWITCLEGTLDFVELFCKKAKKLQSILVNNIPVAFSYAQNGKVLTNVSLHTGDKLTLCYTENL